MTQNLQIALIDSAIALCSMTHATECACSSSCVQGEPAPFYEMKVKGA